MNRYCPRHMQDANGNPSGLWHYTVENDGKVWPVGYCALECPGHDTKEGAYEHQKQYILDNATYNGKSENSFQRTQYPCQICQEWTSGYALADMQSYRLCDKHRNREALETLVEIGDVYGSW